MSRRYRDAGSTVQLHGSVQLGTDFIPREYHRKVLKKIAQLTKVIYVLNTKNDEHESFVSRLRATHESEVSRMLSDCTRKLNECKKQLTVKNEANENKFISLNNQLSEVQEKRDKLQNEQVSYRKNLEERLAMVKSHYSERVTDLKKQLMSLKSDQEEQLRQVSLLQAEWSMKLEQQLEETNLIHEKEIIKLQEKLHKQSGNEISSFEAKLQGELRVLRSNLEAKLKAEKVEMSLFHKISMEERVKEMEEDNQKHLVKQEEFLKDQLSSLMKDLRATKDKLALSEQKVSDLLTHCEQSEVGSVKLQTRLMAAHDKAEGMRSMLRHVQNELEASHDLYGQQRREIDKMATALDQSNALRITNEGIIGKLQFQILESEKVIEALEDENKKLKSSQLSTKEQQLTQMYSLDKELEKLKSEKQLIKLQFAREIEAAQVCLGERESQFISEHLETLQQLQKEKQQALLDAKTAHEDATEQMKKQMQGEKEKELLDLEERWKKENGQLMGSLSNQVMELELAREELKRLEAELAMKEKGLGSAASSQYKLKEELTAVKRDLANIHREQEHNMQENHKVSMALESMKERAEKMARTHQDQLKELRRKLTQELEVHWKNKLKQECGALRQELSFRHDGDSRVALLELAGLKDKTMEQASEKWENNRRQLFNKILSLEDLLREMQESNSSTLEEARCAAEKQLDDLRHQLKDQTVQHLTLTKQLKQSHADELGAQWSQLEASKEATVNRLVEKNRTEQQEKQRANKLAIRAMKDKISQENQAVMEEMRQEHTKEMAIVRKQHLAEKDEAVERLDVDHNRELKGFQRDVEIMMAKMKKEVVEHEITVASLSTDKEEQEAELSKLRGKVNTLMVEANKLQKELQFEEQEVQRVRRESKALLQQQGSELSAAHIAELESVRMQHKHQSQRLLMDFNTAKALFANKLQQLEKEACDWEKRYKSRESRPEDLDKIRELELTTNQLKMKTKDLIAEKRVYQLELINREKNYNQIFNSNPHIGILDPLAHKHACGGLEGSHYQSAPSLISHHHQHRHPLPPSSLSSLKNPQEILLRKPPHVDGKSRPRKAVILTKESPLIKHKFSDSNSSIIGTSKGSRDNGLRKSHEVASSLPQLMPLAPLTLVGQ